MPFQIFLDSDVIISSLISSSGAAYLLINNVKGLELYISNFSLKELEIVTGRLGIGSNQLIQVIKKCKKIDMKESDKAIKKKYLDYVLDINDAHIIAGSKEARVRFLISYNIKHYKVDNIKKDFGIIVLTPAQFIQYLRSL